MANTITRTQTKLLHVLNNLNYSGAEVMLYDAYDFFEEKGFEQHILCNGTALGPYKQVLEEKGYIIHFIPATKSIGFLVDMYQFFRSNKFDVVHIHPEMLYFWKCISTKLANPNLKIVRTYHDVFDKYSSIQKKSREYQRMICNKYFGVTGVSIGESVHKIEKEMLKNDTAIVYNWIDETKFRPPLPEEIVKARAEFGIAPDAFVVLTVGTCNDKKCHNDIFEAVKRVKDQIPNIVFLHRGSGPNAEQEKRYVEELGIAENVKFLGYIEDLPKVFWAADAFIFSSKWEGLGDVIIEAIACKLPVILYSGHGMNDFKPAAEKDTYGYWLNHKTERFDEAILDVYKKKQDGTITDWKEKAFQYFQNKFSRSNSLHKLLNIYLNN
ncbi:glycosyltransferase [Pontibacter vulgaris]|uniref:glycosyltransferase n=1 Tax=Pontibacter vulgaris TaxID=2905679 RepID=UPI001FA6FF63|nr:glycosyltransferase [Pontibacter vulgaris]